MLIPPVLEVYLLWHPQDVVGEAVASAVLKHFHGTAFSGLVGGAVEVYERSAGWETDDGPPRPLPVMEDLPNGLAPAALTAVVPVLGTHLARAAEEDSRWRTYLQDLALEVAGRSDVALLGLVADAGVLVEGSQLTAIFGAGQMLDRRGAEDPAVLCRDLSHSITALASGSVGKPLRVFISHTKRNSPDEEPDPVQELVTQVRAVIGDTHLRPYFDAVDVQPGTPWEEELIAAAETSALLVVRTDLFASRDWCQREVLAAKRADMPVVVLHALLDGEERGCFLMDHIPSVACDRTDGSAQRDAIERSLNKLVDEALKRALWRHQKEQLHSLGFDWLPANAPEPVTLAPWLRTLGKRPTSDDRLFVLHPDPPLGYAEMNALHDLLALGGMDGLVEILTPRSFASRGGQVKP